MDMLEYNVTLLRLDNLKVILEGVWKDARLVVDCRIDNNKPSGVGFMPRNLDNKYSISRICLIRARLFIESDEQPEKPKCTLELFYDGEHLVNGLFPLTNEGYPVRGATTIQALREFLSQITKMAPDRDGDNKIGPALAALW